MQEKELELLAPAGKMDVLEAVIRAGADAVYLGGKRYNMRMLRPDFNFSRDELKIAVDMLHHQNKKLYITVNNLYTNEEMEDLSEYLIFLDGIGVDALIVQDLGLIHFHRELGLKVPLHGSVQMGLANAKAVQLLEQNRFSRVILSKNLNLHEIKQIHEATTLGIEYFVHGDLCISHTGQCHLSSFLFGDSGNRGRCQKPCRWKYEVLGEKNEEYTGFQHFLAHNDLCLYDYLQDLIGSGVTSFKIEGRMRKAEFVSALVQIYRRELDRILENGDRTNEVDRKELQNMRVRNYTTGNLFRVTGKESIGFDGLREPIIPSSEIPLETLDYKSLNLVTVIIPKTQPEISVRVGDLKSLHGAINAGADQIILGLESFRQSQSRWSKVTIQEAVAVCHEKNCMLLLETPRIVAQSELSNISELQRWASLTELSGFVVNDLGSLQILKTSGKVIWGGVGLNVANRYAASFLRSCGISRINVSAECNAAELSGFVDADADLELMVHGPMVGMISDYCIPCTVSDLDREVCGSQCVKHEYALHDQLGHKYLVRTDEQCRNYLFCPHDRCLYQRLPQIMDWGVKSIRIDGQFYKADQLEQLVRIYRQAIEQITAADWNGQRPMELILNMFPEGLTEGTLYMEKDPLT